MKLEPLKFRPYLKPVIWGGDKICRYKKIKQPEPNIGESWEISVVPGHESIVEEGFYEGRKLTDLIEEFGEELLGKSVVKKYDNKFPLLIKIIDANDNLSVQVHPDDFLAKQRHNSLGKTEMWYIIKSDTNARIYSGLNREISPEEYEKHIADGDFESLLAVHDSNPGDIFYLPAGRIHAIGAGNLLAEIQESSDITYRIYDYNRKDAFGNTRELHTSLAKDAIDYKLYDNYKNPPVPEDIADYEIVSCSHFKTRRLLIDGNMELKTDDDSFTVLMCLKGEVEMIFDGRKQTLKEGHSALIPAALKEMSLSGRATILSTRC